MNINNMINDINTEIHSFTGSISILIKDLKNNIVHYDINSTERVVSASIIKVFILITLFNKINKGELNLDDNVQIPRNELLEDSYITEIYDSTFTIEDLATWMIINSDNVSTNVLINIVGFKEINNLCISLGLNDTSIHRKMLDYEAISNGYNNYTSMKDSLKIMELLYNNDFISKKVCASILNILKNQRDNSLIRRYIYNYNQIANKTGELPGVLHDMGIVYGQKTDYFIGVFLTGVDNINESERLIGKISKIVYEYLA